MTNGDDTDDTELFRQAMKGINQSHRNYKNTKVEKYKSSPGIKIKKTEPNHLSFDQAHGTVARIAIDQTDEGDTVLFARPGLQRRVLRQLKRGEIPWQSDLDLHGMRTHEAESMLDDFLNHALERGEKCILIIHGKGYHSENKKGVLKPFTLSWLKQMNQVNAFCSATPRDGGTGAVYVLLKSIGKSIDKSTTEF